MKKYKLLIDILMGLAVPLAILKLGTGVLGARPAYVLSALIPAAYVLWDLLFYSKRFNFLTTLVAIQAVTRGGLAFLKVDGWRYALQDSVGTAIQVAIFGVMLALGRPVTRFVIAQVLDPQDERERAAHARLLTRPGVHRALVWGTLIVLLENVGGGVVNVWLNLTHVTASFGTEQFNSQKANVDAMTRIIFPISGIGAMLGAYWLANKAMDAWLGDAVDGGGTLVEQIERRELAGEGVATSTAPAEIVRKRPAATEGE